LWAARDIGIGADDFTDFEIPNPENASEMIKVYDLVEGTQIGDVFTVSSDIDKAAYHGFELSVNARLASGGTLIGGWYTDRKLETRCDTNDPNNYRFCDESGQLFQDHGAVDAIPFRNEFKLAIAHPLPWDFLGSVSFISYPGTGSTQRSYNRGQDKRWRDVTYQVPTGMFPGGSPTVPVDPILLLSPGTYLERWNQLDASLKRTFRAGGMEFLPSLDLFNMTNSAVVLQEVEGYGSARGRPLTILGGRMMRLGVLMRF
jgi:outer membrane receptor protein involved in Fe transport